MLLQHLVGIVDTQLLEGVHGERVEAEYIQDAHVSFHGRFDDQRLQSCIDLVVVVVVVVVVVEVDEA